MTARLSMVDVGGKAPTRRRAVASCGLRMGARAFALLRSGRLPKGDALALGEAAGVLAAKRASQTIPLCHPLPLDHVSVRFELDARLPGVRVYCEASAFAKTGVEMEALAGAQGAALAVYDLVKQVDPALVILETRLELKEGGKSGVWRHPESAGSANGSKAVSLKGRAAVITVSDRGAAGRRKDVSGPLLRDGLKALGFSVVMPLVVPDERERIAAAIRLLAKKADLVLLTGGTGLSPRDVTPEAVADVCDRLIPGIGEALRLAGAASTPTAALSRSVAGQLGRTVVVALPGSPGGARDGLAVLAPLLGHALHIASGGDHER